MAEKKLKKKTRKASKKVSRSPKEKVKKQAKAVRGGTSSLREGSAKKPGVKEEGFIANLKKFFRSVAHEYKQIIWPSPREVLQASILVIIIMVILSIYMYLVDIGSALAIKFLRNFFTKI